MVVVFDMDDTLFPERAFVLSAFAAVGDFAERKWGVSGLTEKATALFNAGERRDIFQKAFLQLDRAPLTSTQIQELLLSYRMHAPSTLPWFPDAQRVVQKLSTQYTLSLISDGFLPTQRNKAKALGLERWISQPIFTEELGREYWKPSPRAYELIMQRHPSSRYLYVADNPSKDFIAPNALGWRTVQVRRPDGQYRDVTPAENGEPLHIIATLEELLPIL